MKREMIQDERIIFVKRKIQSDGFQLLLLVLLLSVMFQQIILKAPFPQYAAEFFCFFGGSAYLLIRNLMMGTYTGIQNQRSCRSILLQIMISGFLAILLMVILYGETDQYNLLLFFVSFTVFGFLSQVIVRAINKKRLHKIDEKIREDEKD